MDDFHILYVDDDPEILALVQKYLSSHGYRVQVADSGETALTRMRNGHYDLVFTDYKMPRMDGLELLSYIKRNAPDTVVVIVTGHGTMDAAIQAMRHGGYDFLQKPFKLEMLRLLVDKVAEEKKLREARVILRRRVTPRHRYGDLVGMHLRMQEIYERIESMKDTHADFLLIGETGTGKKLTARMIHAHGPQAGRPFREVDCAALAGDGGKAPEQVLVEMADAFRRGALYLDEICRLPRAAQKWLVERPSDTEVRVLASIGLSPEAAVAEGVLDKALLDRFEDRLLSLPPLRERREDICLLVLHFLHRLNETARTPVTGLAPRALDLFLRYDWPGNVIQLESTLQRAVALGVEGSLDVDDLPEELRTFGRAHRVF
jgi:DNA-binding NtrC family response regulator